MYIHFHTQIFLAFVNLADFPILTICLAGTHSKTRR